MIRRALGPRAFPIVLFGIALTMVGLSVRTAWIALHEPLTRDHGIFMYVAWALEQGVRDYSGVREQNGPLVHLLWLLFYKISKLGGDDELVVRAIEMVGNTVVFFGIGAALPDLGRVRPISMGTRIAWAGLTCAMLSADYLSYGIWGRTERESHFVLLLVPSLAMQLRAQSPSALSARARAFLLGGAGALAVLPGFGKPPAWIFFAGQLVTLLLDDEAPLSRAARLRAFCAGAAIGLVPIGWFVWRYADPVAMLRFVFYEAPRLHYYIARESLVSGWYKCENAGRLERSTVLTALAILVAWRRLIPRRMWPLLSFVLCSWVTLIVQGKMLQYHQVTLTCATVLFVVALLVLLAERTPVGSFSCALVVAGAAIYVMRTGAVGIDVPHDALLYSSRSLRARQHELPQLYDRPIIRCNDFCPGNLRAAGAYLRKSLPEHERVQLWGMDAYLLFFARRLSATPYLYSYEINVDAALKGGEGGVPGEGQRAWLKAEGRHNCEALDAQLRAAPPGAFAILDRQPFLFPDSGAAELVSHCAEVGAFLTERYVEQRAFDTVHIWLRKDLVKGGVVGTTPPTGASSVHVQSR